MSTGYFSNSPVSSVTNCRFSPIIVAGGFLGHMFHQFEYTAICPTNTNYQNRGHSCLEHSIILRLCHDTASVIIPVDWSHSFTPQSLSRVIPSLVGTLLNLTWKLRNSSISKRGKECPLTVLFGRHANKDIVKPLMIISTP
jgi:hypothetical protein